VNFRRLTRSELEDLEPQFVRFLAAQSIPAEDWVKLKVVDVERSDQLVDQFSEMVFHDVIRRVEYLEQRGSSFILAYRCGKEKLSMRGLRIEGNSSVDLRKAVPPAESIAQLQSSGAKAKLLHAEREYAPSRDAELFKLLEGQAAIAKTSELFNLLDSCFHYSESPEA